MVLEPLAKELVEAVSALVGGRTINIMDTNGIIIASTERERVGSFHQGAMEAVHTGKMVNITREQVSAYPGAKEGCNMPLRVNGAIIGVVGIWGEPSEIQALAHLLEVYAAKYFQLEAAASSPRLAESELRGRVLQALLAPTDKTMADARVLMDSLKIHLEFPLQVVLFFDRTGAARMGRQESLLAFLAARGWLRPEREVWGTVNDQLVLVCACEGRALSSLCQNGGEREMREYKLCVGGVCHSLWDIAEAYKQATALAFLSDKPLSDLRDSDTRADYILYSAALHETDFLEELYGKLVKSFREEELRLLLRSAESYYRHGRSVTRAAAELFIHKNTLLYRIRRLLEALGFDGYSSFQQEFLMRLLLEHGKRKQGRQALE